MLIVLIPSTAYGISSYSNETQSNTLMYQKQNQQKHTNNIQFNEIAWMGTATSGSDEWIELYNPTNTNMILNGWSIQTKNHSLSITLQGTIPAYGFFLLERTDDNSAPAQADQIYKGTLKNDGEHLLLVDATNNTVDEVTMWYAGDNQSKYTMARSSSHTWHHGIRNGTPKKENAFAPIANKSTPQTNITPSVQKNTPYMTLGIGVIAISTATILILRIMYRPTKSNTYRLDH